MTTPLMATYSGKLVNPLHLQPGDVCIEDIAHALACTNRFYGHARVPINVAQHSVYVSVLCAPSQALQCLLHDGSEAYLGDVNSHLKASKEMGAYRAAEERAQSVIYQFFGCTDIQDITEYDRYMLWLEAGEGFDHARVKTWPNAPSVLPFLHGWKPWGWQKSEHVFLKRYEAIRRREA